MRYRNKFEARDEAMLLAERLSGKSWRNYWRIDLRANWGDTDCYHFRLELKNIPNVTAWLRPVEYGHSIWYEIQLNDASFGVYLKEENPETLLPNALAIMEDRLKRQQDGCARLRMMMAKTAAKKLVAEEELA